MERDALANTISIDYEAPRLELTINTVYTRERERERGLLNVSFVTMGTCLKQAVHDI